jgi:hypothetical protein
MPIDASQLSPQIQQYIQDAITAAQAARDAANSPKILSPQERVAAALAGIDAAESRERVAPGHNDHVVGAIITYLHALADYTASLVTHGAEQSAPPTSIQASEDAPAVEAAAPLAGD